MALTLDSAMSDEGRYAGVLGPSDVTMVTARNSTYTGHQGLRQAVQDAVLAVDQVAALGFGDFRAAIPSEKDLIERLRSSEDVAVIDGRKWRYYTFVIPGLYLVVCAGSGTKTDERGTQPFMERIRDTILTLRPRIVFARELDRLGRDELGLGQIVRAVDRVSAAGHECHLASGDRGLLPKYPGWDVNLYFEGRQARTQAESTARRTRDTMIKQTGREMAGGRFIYPLGAAVPAGLGQVRLKDARGGKGSVVAYLDCAQFRPSADEVFEPLSQSHDAQGNIADQVECVRWAFVEMANGRPPVDIVATMFARGYSTVGLRRLKGLDATFLSEYGRFSAQRATGLCHRLAEHIDFYESGVLKRVLRDTEILITNVMPPGGWVSDDVAAAIRVWKAQRRRARLHQAKTSFGGLPVLVNGVGARLALVSPSCGCGVEDPE